MTQGSTELLIRSNAAYTGAPEESWQRQLGELRDLPEQRLPPPPRPARVVRYGTTPVVVYDVPPHRPPLPARLVFAAYEAVAHVGRCLTRGVVR